MKPTHCKHLIDSYVEWLKRELSGRALDNACELTTPFLDRHNDHLQIYAYEDNGKIILTDDGYILEDLKASGIDFNSPTRKSALETTLRGFGVQRENGKICVEASSENLAQRVHMLIQSMLSVNDMFVLVQQPRVASFFWDDVKEFFEVHKIPYEPRVKIVGSTGYDHTIDFLIPQSKDHPECFVNTLNAPNKTNVASCVFTANDVRAKRANGTLAYAILNDDDKKVPHSAENAMKQNKVQLVKWSQCEEHVADWIT